MASELQNPRAPSKITQSGLFPQKRKAKATWGGAAHRPSASSGQASYGGNSTGHFHLRLPAPALRGECGPHRGSLLAGVTLRVRGGEPAPFRLTPVPAVGAPLC